MTQSTFDIAVIGGGPGGYVAAIRAAQLGARVVLIEREALGGVCLNWGCIPTKALLHAAEAWRGLREADSLGLKVEGASFDFEKVMKRSRDVASRLSRGVRGLLSKSGVTVVPGEARLLGEGRIQVNSSNGVVSTLVALDIVLATGARPRELPGMRPDGVRIWSSRDALSTKTMPKSLLVVGGGAIGMEFASFFQAFGCEVTVLEAQERVLPLEDEEVSVEVARSYGEQGVRILAKAQLESLEVMPSHVSARIRGGQEVGPVQVEAVLIAVGVVGNVEGLGLELTGVKVESGRIVADAFGATADPRVHAIGDVTGGPWLAHRAMHQGIACVERIRGLSGGHALKPEDVPGCTYGYPQTASIGLTEEAARKRGLSFKVGKFPLVGNGKAVALGEPHGFIKTLVDTATGEILGAHMVGPSVTELIGSFSVARALEATDDALLAAVWPHPTISESLHEAVLAASGRALHI